MRRGGPSFADITSFTALHAAALRASRGLSSRPAVARYLVDLEPELLALQRELLAAQYQPRPLRHFRIRDPKPRTISVAHFRDRVVHHALCAGIARFLEVACQPGDAPQEQKGAPKGGQKGGQKSPLLVLKRTQ